MFTVLVYMLEGDTFVLVRRVPNVFFVEFKDGAFSVFVLSPVDEPDIISFDSSYHLVCCRV